MAGSVTTDRVEIGLSGQKYTIMQGTNGLEVWRGPADAPVALIETIDVQGKPHASTTYNGTHTIRANVGNALSISGQDANFTAPSAGVYLVTATANGTVNARMLCNLSINGGTPPGWTDVEFLDTIGSLNTSLNCSSTHAVLLSAGDVLTMRPTIFNAADVVAITVTKL